jgi:hypothetical protein
MADQKGWSLPAHQFFPGHSVMYCFFIAGPAFVAKILLALNHINRQLDLRLQLVS